MAFLNRSLRISLTDEREEAEEVSAPGVDDEDDNGMDRAKRAPATTRPAVPLRKPQAGPSPPKALRPLPLEHYRTTRPAR